MVFGDSKIINLNRKLINMSTQTKKQYATERSKELKDSRKQIELYQAILNSKKNITEIDKILKGFEGEFDVEQAIEKIEKEQEDNLL